MKGKLKTYVIGFAVFFAYYLVARIIENKVAPVRKVINLGS